MMCNSAACEIHSVLGAWYYFRELQCVYFLMRKSTLKYLKQCHVTEESKKANRTKAEYCRNNLQNMLNREHLD